MDGCAAASLFSIRLASPTTRLSIHSPIRHYSRHLRSAPSGQPSFRFPSFGPILTEPSCLGQRFLLIQPFNYPIVRLTTT
ncbi:hypothetical protein ABKN59_010722 [Abortiporus biennis]